MFKRTKRVSRWDIVALIGVGLIGTITFIKKDMTTRVLTGRMGVGKHTVGGKRTTDPNQYLIVWETHNKQGFKGRDAYRNVNIFTILSFVVGGVTYIPREPIPVGFEANELPNHFAA